MKRLTTWTSMDGKAKLIVTDGTLSDKLIEQIAIQRLAEYEDAEEQGLLVRLPCKVGDSFFAIEKYCDEHGELPYATEHYGSDCLGCELPCNGDLLIVERKITEVSQAVALINSIGKTVFLTREAAEKALEDA